MERGLRKGENTVVSSHTRHQGGPSYNRLSILEIGECGDTVFYLKTTAWVGRDGS